MTGHYVWVDGKPYPNGWADEAGHDFIQTDLDGAVVYGPDGRAQVVVPGETVRHFDPRPPMTDAASVGFDADRQDTAAVVSERGAGYLGAVYPDQYGRNTRTFYRPYVILPDGTREDLQEDPNYLGALAQLSERLRKGTPNP